MGTNIQKGDIVKVFFERRESIIGEVVYVPCQPGDVWVLKEREGNLPVVLGSFCFLAVVSRSI